MSGTACTRACGYCGRCTSTWEREDADVAPTPCAPCPDYFGIATAHARRYQGQVQRGERVAPLLTEDPPF